MKKEFVKRIGKTAFLAVAAASLVVSVPLGVSASTKTLESYPVSSGVTYSHYTHAGTSHVNHIKVDLTDQYTKLAIGVPSPLAKTATTTDLANRDSRDGNRVVGAVNASFFDMKTGLPMYLISQKNEIINGGVISTSRDYYVSEPIAFGVLKDGRAEIDDYNFGIQVEHNGRTLQMTGLNRERQNDETIIFTPQHQSKYTNSNEFGIEIVVDTGQPITSTYYGQQLTGKVVKVRDYGSKEKIEIPRTGFVISAHGAKPLERLKSMRVGDAVSFNLSIDDKWKDSEFMLASGPMLVKDGRPHITMNTSNWRAKALTARTAIAISKDKKQVHLVTVDHRRGYSNGMTLTQFASYLASQGYDRAINFDGGGSTTLGLRKYGSQTVVLGNRTTNSSQRRVSAIVEAISTAPISDPAIINVTREKIGDILVGATVPLKINYVLDAFYNPLTVDQNQVQISSEKGHATAAGLAYKGVKAGKDRVTIQYGAAKQSFPITVVEAPAKLSITPTTKTVKPGSSVSFKVSATDASGKPIVYEPAQLQWEVEGNIGTISSTGVFKASTSSASGKIIATLGTKKASLPITISAQKPPLKEKPSKQAFKDISPQHAYYKEISYLKDRGFIKGDLDGNFNPGQTLSREHASVILSRVFGAETTSSTKQLFSDVPPTHRYFKEIQAIANANLVGGKQDGTFGPTGELTRAQMAAILVKAYGLSGKSAKTFIDVPSSHWAYQQIHTLAHHGITTGNEKGQFQPNKPVNRAQFSAFLYRSMTKK